MVYVSNTGCLIKLTDRQWEKYLIAKSRDHNAAPEEYGTPLDEVTNVTDWTCGDAEAALVEFYKPTK